MKIRMNSTKKNWRGNKSKDPLAGRNAFVKICYTMTMKDKELIFLCIDIESKRKRERGGERIHAQI